MNKLLAQIRTEVIKAQGGAYGLATVLSALRGPDSMDPESRTAKRRFTAPIRLWFYGPEAYAQLSIDPSCASDVQPLTEAHLQVLYKEAYAHDGAIPSGHYWNHIQRALQVIAAHEGWSAYVRHSSSVL